MVGHRRTERQDEFWIATQDLAVAPRHVFYERLNAVLAAGGFDAWVEDLCGPYYAVGGRPSVPPGVFFRMLLLGYFEDIDSQRGIAWRCQDSLSIKQFLGYRLQEATPDHSSLTKIRERLPDEVYGEVFRFVIQLMDEHGLLSAQAVGVDATMLEANAAMKSIVRKDTGEDWEEYLKRLAAQDGLKLKSKSELIRYDKERNRKGVKKVSNEEWESPADGDARIAKMKDGTTHLAYKAEHVVDLPSGAILAAEVYHADQSDHATLTESLEQAQRNLDQSETYLRVGKVAADKGYHKAETLAKCAELGPLGVKTYIAEPDKRHRRRWTDKPPEQEWAVNENRRRLRRDYGKRLQRRRSEVVERTFAHVCETGGGRRSWLRGLQNVRKSHLMRAAAHNLGLILRKLLGAGKPRAYAACAALFSCLSALYTAQPTQAAERNLKLDWRSTANAEPNQTFALAI